MPQRAGPKPQVRLSENNAYQLSEMAENNLRTLTQETNAFIRQHLKGNTRQKRARKKKS